MPDTFDSVVSGDPIPTDARLFNALVDLARAAPPAQPKGVKFPSWNPLLIRAVPVSGQSIGNYNLCSLTKGFSQGVHVPVIEPANLTGLSGEAACIVTGQFNMPGMAGLVNDNGAASVPPLGAMWCLNKEYIGGALGGMTTVFTMTWAIAGGLVFCAVGIRATINLPQPAMHLMRFQFPNQHAPISGMVSIPTCRSYIGLNRGNAANDLICEILWYDKTISNRVVPLAIVRLSHRNPVRKLSGGQYVSTSYGSGITTTTWPATLVGNTTILTTAIDSILARPGPRTMSGRITWSFRPRWTYGGKYCTGSATPSVFSTTATCGRRLPATLETAWRLYKLNPSTGATTLIKWEYGPTLDYPGDADEAGDNTQQVVMHFDFEHTFYLNDFQYPILVEFVVKQTGGTVTGTTYGTGTPTDPYQAGLSSFGIATARSDMFCWVAQNQFGVGGNFATPTKPPPVDI